MIVCGWVYTIDENAYPQAIKFVDPCFALLSISICILTSTKLIKDLSVMLLQGVPTNLPKIEDIEKSILEKCATYVINVHEVHIWSLDPNRIMGSLHVTYNNFEVCLKLIPLANAALHEAVLDRGIWSQTEHVFRKNRIKRAFLTLQ